MSLITESIKTRRSVRNYTGEKLNKTHKNELLEYINNDINLEGPFGNKIKIIYKESTDELKSGKIGTYGFIKNAPAFLICICDNNKENLIDLGYVLENLILFLNEKEIGTCWIGGTFNRKKLQMKHSLSVDEFIPIITPVGYPEDNKHRLEKIIRKLARSDNRKNFDQLFFYKNFENKISERTIRDKLEYVRLAPSASNKQPWRIVISTDNIIHFFIERSPAYAKSLGYDIQMIDMGIALSHYMIVFESKSVKMIDHKIDLPNTYYEYVFSVN